MYKYRPYEESFVAVLLWVGALFQFSAGAAVSPGSRYRLGTCGARRRQLFPLVPRVAVGWSQLPLRASFRNCSLKFILLIH